MKLYSSRQRMIGCILLINLAVQSCYPLSNSNVFLEEVQSQQLKSNQDSFIDSFSNQEDQQIIAKDGHLVSFCQKAKEIKAIVEENAPLGFRRKLRLPVYKSPSFSVIQTTNQLKREGHLKNQVCICFPEKDPRGKGYVYLGSTGLMGGVKNKNKKGKNKKEKPSSPDDEELLNQAIKNNEKEKKENETSINPLHLSGYVSEFQEAWFQDPENAYKTTSFKKIIAVDENLLTRIQILYPHDIKTPIEKIGRYEALVKFYQNGSVIPSFSKQENVEKINRLRKELVVLARNKNNQSKLAEIANLIAEGEAHLKDSNYKEAANFFIKARPHPQAFFLEGKCYVENGIKNNQFNALEAAKNFRKAAFPESFAKLADMYMDGLLEEIPNYLEAEKYFELAGMPSALYNIGYLYYSGLIGKVGDQPDYKKAKEYYEKSGTSEAFGNLADMYYYGQIGDRPNYEKAKEYFEKLDHPTALANLGVMYYYGRIGGRPNYEKAKEYFKKAGTPRDLFYLGVMHGSGEIGKIGEHPNYQKAKEYYEKSGTPDALCNLGIMYLGGEIGKHPNYQKAEEYFKQSNSSLSLFHLGKIYENGYINNTYDYLEALKCYELSSNAEAKVASIKLLKLEEFAVGFSSAEIEQKIQANIDKLNSELLLTNQTWTSKYHYIQGLKEWALNNWNSSLIHLQHALDLGYEKEDIIIGIVKQIEEALGLEEKQDEVIVSSTSKQIFSGKEAITSQEVINKTEVIISQKKEEIKKEEKQDEEYHSEKEGEFYPFFIPKKDTLTKEQKKERRTKIRKVEFLTLINKIKENSTSPDIPMELTFLNEKQNQEFWRVQKESKKISELIEEVKCNKYEVVGAGKPEVLKGTYKGYDGCFSRRINNKDRLVYKIQNNKILILSWEGHYE